MDNINGYMYVYDLHCHCYLHVTYAELWLVRQINSFGVQVALLGKQCVQLVTCFNAIVASICSCDGRLRWIYSVALIDGLPTADI